jgi:mannose-1-phosphate guanylyltransferase/mannose-6-phosphate isomerase
MIFNCVIMCGGSGSRLWPLSRKKLPKQFLKLVNNKTMLQNTILRFKKLEDKLEKINYTIICNKDHYFIIDKQIHELKLENNFRIICEPEGRDTAAVVAIASLIEHENTNTVVVPSDHIFDDDEICNVIVNGLKYINDGIITMGIKPKSPQTGYGYINVDDSNNTIKFVEKPDLETAQKYFEDGNYLWNSGLFLFKNKNMIKCFNSYANDILHNCKNTIKNTDISSEVIHLDSLSFEKCKKISIDYAIMEPLTQSKNKVVNCYTIPYNGYWSDIGSFDSLYNEIKKDQNNNVIKGDVITLDTNNCYIESENKTVTTIGLKDLVIVDTRDALLVCDKSKSQDVKKMTKLVNDKKKELLEIHAKAYRPWGWYTNIEGNDYSGFKVKRIGVYPKKRLSLQSHDKRSEHWVMIKGKAKVQVGKDFHILHKNQSVYIPIGVLHRMENIGSEMVEFIETQIGDYLGEDDIKRYQDDFGRV